MNTNHPQRLQGMTFAGIGAIAFSGKAIIVKLAYRYDVDAVTVLMYRMLFSLPLFLALAWWSSRGRPSLTRQDWLRLLILGFTGYYLASFLDFAGLQYITASLERLILYLNPTIVLLLGMAFFGAAVSRRQWLALLVSYLGVLVVFGHDIRIGGDGAILGSALVFGSALSYALYLLLSGAAVKRLGTMRLAGVATSIACVLCIAQFFLLRPVTAMIVHPGVIGLSVLNAGLCTFLPVILVMMAIRRVGAGAAAQMGMVGPVSTIALSVMILDEPMTAWILAGTVLVLTGVWLLTRWRA